VVQPGQLQAPDPAGAVQLGQVGPQPLLAGLVVAVGGHQQKPLPAQVPDQEGEQVAGGAVGPVKVFHHDNQRGLFTEVPQQPKQQLEQPRLSGLAWRAAASRLAKRWHQASKLWPGWAHQLSDRPHADLAQQGP
jgi:hypothetical protein